MNNRTRTGTAVGGATGEPNVISVFGAKIQARQTALLPRLLPSKLDAEEAVQADLQRQIERRAPSGQMTTEVSAGSVTDAEFLDQGEITQAAVLQIACCEPALAESSPGGDKFFVEAVAAARRRSPGERSQLQQESRTPGRDRHRGVGRPPAHAIPPCVWVRTRRFESVTLTVLEK